MPFSIWVTRADSYQQAHGEAVANLATPMVCERGPANLSRADLGIMFDALEAGEHPADHAHWLRYPDTREPWCSVFTTPFEGPLRHVELSTSYSNPRFMRNMLDMFDLGLRLAKSLGAKLYEETAGRLIAPEDVDGFLAHEGDFVTGQHRFWKSGQQRLWSEMHAPLEFPLGAIDRVSDYLAFPIAMAGVTPAALAADVPAHLEAHVLEHSVVLEDRESGAPVVRLIALEDGAIVRPYWSHLPFAHLARETFRAVERVEARGGRVTYHGKPAGAAVRAELESHAQGLGVEYFEWLQAR